MDQFSKVERSAIMRQVKSSGNKSTEERLISALRKNKIAGWRRNYRLSGKPDLVFPQNRLVIFLDGCFWHGCPKCYRRPATNREYWDAKVDRNKRRDRAVSSDLRSKGWKVLRIWECDLKTLPKVLNRIKRNLV
jgi:DNA mismatch endonuclease (patch repair protein)